MAEPGSGERSFEATERRMDQARERGELPVAREAPIATLYIAALLAVILMGGPIARQIGEIVLPMFDQPDMVQNFTINGWRDSGRAVAIALGLAVTPFFVLTVVGSLLPYLLQNAITLAPERIAPKLSHLSPAKGVKRIFGGRAMFEFAKSLSKMVVVGAAAYVVARPIYEHSVGYLSTDLVLLPPMLQHAVFMILLAATVVSVAIAGIDTPYQHWAHRRRMRMTLQEMREELRESEGDPQVRARRRMLRRKRARSRMMHDVPRATVIITNPTHVAVALRYRRGEDAAPVVVAKGVELIALRIRQIARQHGIAIVEDPPLARMLNSVVEIGETIPHEHFETVAKIIGMIWARRTPVNTYDVK
jgi:flagellar biosynthetic protein FlhB